MFQEIFKQGMLGTEIYFSIFSDKHSKEEIISDFNYLISYISDFEKKYSRFIPGNFLFEFNSSTTSTVDPEFVEILVLCKKYYKITHGVFNPCLLPILLSEGYNVSKTHGIYDESLQTSIDDNSIDLDLVEINGATITKPLNLKIDLGGIGKGYLLNQLSNYLSQKYTNYCIDLGGDLMLSGVDKQKGYPYWAIEVENPLKTPQEVPTLMLSDVAVATSGVNKRSWIKDNMSKNHLIDKYKKSSVNNDILCSTVVSSNPIDADVFAKCILIMGLTRGLEFAQEQSIPVILITKTGQIVSSKYADKYIWREN